jgi:lysophospholipase L1-like esterase
MSDRPSQRAQPLDRRELLKATAALAGAASLAGCSVESHAVPDRDSAWIAGGQTILFQGDSITDAGRDRATAGEVSNQRALGSGYAWLAAAQLMVDRPDAGFRIWNRGISGNKLFQLANRWDDDCLALEPDVLSILVGVNDIWHKLAGSHDGTAQTYEEGFRALLQRTRESLPDVKLVICEPFVLRCGAVDERWFPQFDHFRAAARRVSDEFGGRFVAFQEMFDQAVRHAPPEAWAADGVHPTPAGTALMAHTWLSTVS